MSNLTPNEINTATAIRLLVDEAYPRILNDTNYIPEIKITDTQLKIGHIELNKNPETNFIKCYNNTPVISAQVAAHLKRIYTESFKTLQNTLSTMVLNLYLNNLDFQSSVIPKLGKDLRDNSIFKKELTYTIKVILAKVFKTGFSFQEFVAIYTDTYMKWIGKEESKYLYSHFYDKVTFDMLNLYKQDPEKFQQYMENVETKNYLISGLKLGFAKEEQTVDTLVTRTINYYHNNVPFFNHNIFVKISPQTVKIASQPYGLSNPFTNIVSVLCEENITPPPHTVFKFLERRVSHYPLHQLPQKLTLASNIKQHKKDIKFKGSLVKLYKELLLEQFPMSKDNPYPVSFSHAEDEYGRPIPF